MGNLKLGELVWTGKPYLYGYVQSMEDDCIVVIDIDENTEVDCSPNEVQKLPPFMIGKDSEVLKQKYNESFLYVEIVDAIPTSTEITFDEAIRSGYKSKFYDVL